jgi:hypothetical protein
MRKLFLILTLLVAMTGACSRQAPREAAQKFADDYRSISQKFTSLSRTLSDAIGQAQNRPEHTRATEEYNRAQTTHRTELEKLLFRYEKSPDSDELQLLRSRVLIELARFAEADKLLDDLLNRSSPLSSAARIEKIKTCIINRRLDAALAFFRDVETVAPHDINYYGFMTFFAMESPDPRVRQEFSRKIMSATDMPPEIEANRPRLYANLGLIAWRNNEVGRAKEILREAVAITKDPTLAKSLQKRINQLELIGKPASALTADTWLNGNAPATKGQVVILNFWATWVQPCRIGMARLEKFFTGRKEPGLVLIGMTKLYGDYTDETGKQEKLMPEAETARIQEFLKRNSITYPIGIDRQGKAFESFHVSALPSTVIIDRRGVIRQVAIGASQESVLLNQIQPLLEEKP